MFGEEFINLRVALIDFFRGVNVKFLYIFFFILRFLYSFFEQFIFFPFRLSVHLASVLRYFVGKFIS